MTSTQDYEERERTYPAAAQAIAQHALWEHATNRANGPILAAITAAAEWATNNPQASIGQIPARAIGEVADKAREDSGFWRGVIQEQYVKLDPGKQANMFGR